MRLREAGAFGELAFRPLAVIAPEPQLAEDESEELSKVQPTPSIRVCESRPASPS